jgi:RNA polymerase sigma-70 factor (TIGR02957 family)
MSEADPFATLRPTLFALAYRMLGSASDAEDVLQDAFMRYAAAPRDDVRVPKAYLSTLITRLCLDRLKAARSTRESYIGPWLPEPLLTDDGLGPQRTAELHESITLAFLVMLETLTPQERAVFLLREVFEYPYDEIAQILALSQANCRQIFHRAKSQLAVPRPRFPASPTQQRQLVERFLAATERGDMGALEQLLSEDVRFWGDSGGVTPSPRRPIDGRGKVIRLLQGVMRRSLELVGGDPTAIRGSIASVNGEPAIVVWIHDQLDSVMVCTVADDRIATLSFIRNPQKLAYIKRQLADTTL